VALTLAISARGALAEPAWVSEPSPTTAQLYGVAHGDASTWIAVGDGGVILRSTDGGVVWSPVPSPVGDALRGVSLRGSLGIAAGIAGRIIRTTDGGAHWALAARPTTRNLYAVSIGPTVAVVTGEEGQIFVSIDDGVNWTLHTAGTASTLFGVSVNGSTGVGVGGQGAIVMSTNAGAGWGLTVPGGALTFFYGTSFATPATGWVVGTASTVPSLIAKSTNSGFSWNEQTAPTAQTLTGVSFAVLDTGTAVGFAGTILHTDDGGATWTSQDSHTARNLNAVSFLDPLLGIAVGDTGIILRTTSGGLLGVGDAGEPAGFGFDVGPSAVLHGRATIGFSIPAAGAVRLGLYDVSGARVASLADALMQTGHHALELDCSTLPSGVYYCRLEYGGTWHTVRRVVALR